MKDFGLKKLYYSISEVSKITGLEQYILRYWETEFEQLKPSKNRAGNRIYTNKDIKLILEIKKLLREEKYTIEGAKKILSGLNKSPEKDNFAVQNDMTPEKNGKRELKEDLEEIKKFLIELKEKL
ncbi:MerR family transcriptional regulator [Melioribacter roseus P3M-2]|uniref:MerR family transcriptional regulator n=1 Tax=Melioribacter roseus (strain DSM 23840 / JCM 17771 / VKM B-2668 / P3M-2) TaxID=1191523 RepID=I6YYT1_MELRP|nr:MerR family transcriptional regulator [Melioribacter roseus]AFN75742.1 MerR family transcriptional regulator [Melioribacter roseus P3M-2]